MPTAVVPAWTITSAPTGATLPCGALRTCLAHGDCHTVVMGLNAAARRSNRDTAAAGLAEGGQHPLDEQLHVVGFREAGEDHLEHLEAQVDQLAESFDQRLRLAREGRHLAL